MAKPTTPEAARRLRRKRKRERQAVIFTTLVTGLLFLAVMAAAVLSGHIASPFDREFSRQPDDYVDVIEPCPSDPSRLPVATTDIHVRVLNASGRTGLAGRTAEFLEERSFNILMTGDHESQRVPSIHFGIEGLDAAITLRAHAPDAVLIVDERSGTSVDLILGSQFEGLIPQEDVALDPRQPLPSPEGCRPISEITAAEAPSGVPMPPTSAPQEWVPEDDESEGDPNANDDLDGDGDEE